MGERDTIRRVQEDVAAGQLSMARQRLRGLIGSYPQRVDLREQLAGLYRREGILSQAGRWSFLSESRDPEELRAFEREYADPVARMRAVGWRGPEDASGVLARERLAALRAEAEERVGRPVSWEQAAQVHMRTTWGDRIFAVAASLVLGLVLLGGISFLIEGIRTVVHWLSG